MNSQVRNTETSYDLVAEEYARRIFDELKGKPLDCELLDRFVARTREKGSVADVGCGPGHITRYLRERGVQIFGIDLSSEMIGQARTLNPDIQFRQGDMAALKFPDNTLAGIIAFYSIIHIPRGQVVDALREFRRTLLPGGVLLLSFHIGDEVVHADKWWGHDVSLDFTFFQSDEMVEYLESAGLNVVEVIEREPYAPDVEHQSRRSYVFVQKLQDATVK
jgi:SAM-dependent methyltransferase